MQLNQSVQEELKIHKLPGGGYQVVRSTDQAFVPLPILGGPSVDELKARQKEGTLFLLPPPPKKPAQLLRDNPWGGEDEHDRFPVSWARSRYTRW